MASRKFWWLPLLVLQLGSPAHAEAPYRKASFGKMGYANKTLSPGKWYVAANATDIDEERSADIALYRSAILAKAAKFTHIQVVNFKIEVLLYATNNVQLAKLTVAGTNDPNATFECMAKPYFKPNCKVVAVDEVIARLGAQLGQAPQDAARDIELVRAETSRK